MFTAPHGQAALDVVERGNPRPEVIPLDESMPGVDGPTLRRHLSQMAPKVKVIVPSGLAAGDVDARGAQAVLEKPVRAEVLLQTVGDVLGIVVAALLVRSPPLKPKLPDRQQFVSACPGGRLSCPHFRLMLTLWVPA